MTQDIFKKQYHLIKGANDQKKQKKTPRTCELIFIFLNLRKQLQSLINA